MSAATYLELKDILNVVKLLLVTVGRRQSAIDPMTTASELMHDGGMLCGGGGGGVGEIRGGGWPSHVMGSRISKLRSGALQKALIWGSAQRQRAENKALWRGVDVGEGDSPGRELLEGLLMVLGAPADRGAEGRGGDALGPGGSTEKAGGAADSGTEQGS